MVQLEPGNTRHVFVLGVVTGAIYTVASGEAASDGKVLAIYLAVMGALFAAALAWFANRAADSFNDRRQIRRKL